MKSITRQKHLEEIMQQLDGIDRVFIFGCGTCSTLTKTGGREEVLAMKDRLEAAGKLVTGWTVVPTACDEMTGETVRENETALQGAGCLLIMACALGVHRVGLYNSQPVVPALDTLFIGVEDGPGDFREVCAQCGKCILGETAGICPLTACHKGLLNGPCGGTNNGKCEVDKDLECGWQLIIDRLKELGQLDKYEENIPIKDWTTSRDGGPRKRVREDLKL